MAVKDTNAAGADLGADSTALGNAFGARAAEAAALAQERIQQYRWVGRPASPDFMASRETTLLVSNLLVARWLITGESMNADEGAWLGLRGTLAAAEQLSIVNVTRSYLIWRDVAIDVLREEGARLETPATALERALRSVRVSADAAIMNMARTYDAETTRLRLQLAEERETFRHQALHDPLTNLPNRVLLHDRLQQAINSARRQGRLIALLLLDLDQFKSVNDVFGHECGDQVLQQVARRLESALRSSDTVARLGGDEFAIVLPDAADRPSAVATATKIVSTLGEKIELGDRAVTVGGSVGVAYYPDHGTDSDSLLAAADLAMYRAKRGARIDHAVASHVAEAT